jgi:steroid delta-isomerase-like uncharacterized protein
MSAENKAIVQRYYAEGLTQGNVAAVENLIADDMVAHAPGFPAIEGRAAFLNSIRTFREAFTDFHGVIEDMVAEGDRVLVRWTESGRHVREYAGSAPTGKSMTWTGMSLYRLAQGQIVEMWASMDTLGLLRQLGALPSPE